MMELKTLVKNFVPDAATEKKIDAATKKRWKRRYYAAVERIQRAQIKTTPEGFEKYYSLRSEWDSYITSLAPTFCYDLDEIDRALAKAK
jgi:hypothetical protein